MLSKIIGAILDPVSAPAAPTLSTISPFTGGTRNTAYSIVYAALAANSDILPAGTSFLLVALLDGTMTKNGVPVVPGTTTLGPGDTWVWTPDIMGLSVAAFSVEATGPGGTSSPAVTVYVRVTAGAFTFTITGHPITVSWVAPTLVDANFTWTRPNSTTFTGKAPTPPVGFTLNGTYSVFCTDWSQVTGWTVASANNHITAFNIADIANCVSLSLTSITLTNVFNNSFVFDITPFIVPTLTTISVNNSDLSSDVSSWVFTAALTSLNIITATAGPAGFTIHGSMAGWNLTDAVTRFIVSGTGVSGDVSLLHFPYQSGQLSSFDIDGCTHTTYGTGGLLAGSYLTGSSIILIGNNWTQAMVDRALADCVAGGTNSCGLTIYGNTAPSATGLAAVAVLVNRGWAVTTD